MFHITNYRKLELPLVQCIFRMSTKAEAYETYFQEHHIQINTMQRALLGVGSAFLAITDPRRGDMVACMGETAGTYAISYMKKKMENSKEGSDILRDQPRINSETVDLEKLKRLPEGTLGKTYIHFLEENKVTPDSRLPVQFIDDVDLAYVLQRYREVHDLTHTILGMPTNMLGEVTVKWFEAIQTRLPMCILAGTFGPLRLKPKHRQLYKKYYLPWVLETARTSNFLLNTYFERRWEQPISEFHQELNIKPLVIPTN